MEQIPYGERVTLRPEPLPERQAFQKGRECLVTSQSTGLALQQGCKALEVYFKQSNFCFKLELFYFLQRHFRITVYTVQYVSICPVIQSMTKPLQKPTLLPLSGIA